MKKSFEAIITKNKKNGQYNINPLKKTLDMDMKKFFDRNKRVRLMEAD